ncbi:MAG: hypothetical protein WD844_02615 [Thermoleophilaceae bacterium]
MMRPRRLVTLTAALGGSLVSATAAAGPALAAVETKPAGGAALDQVIIATAGAVIATSVLMWLVTAHRRRSGTILERTANFAARIGRLPSWAALPAAIAGGALLIALLGMMWDIALHAGDGRDEGPLANPAHYLILVGLFGVFAAGVLAMTLPKGERPGRAAVKLGKDWYAPVGGVLMAAAGGFALLGFPLDDVWHRMFGQDVTLWGPTHLMLIGGAGMTLVGQAILLAEGMRAQGRDRKAGDSGDTPPVVVMLRRVGLMGGLLLGLSTFQAEFDFGVPQFQAIFHPILIALAAGIGLVAARIWIGRGGAVAAAAFFLVIRAGVAVIVGPVLGESTPYFPLYIGGAVAIELVALAIAARERPLAFGAAAGVALGTVGFATEYAWTQVFMPIAWNEALLPGGMLLALAAAVAAGLIGALLGSGLRGELARPGVARPVFIGSLLVIGALVANGLVTTEPEGLRAQVQLQEVDGDTERDVLATVRVDPPDAAEGSHWFNALAWGGGGKIVVDKLERVGEGVYRSTEPLPVGGSYKSAIRLHDGRAMLLAPVYAPEDRALDAPEIPATAGFTRPFADETQFLQRELKEDTPAWLWTVSSLVVLLISLGFVWTLAWGVARVSRLDTAPPAGPGRRERAEPVATASPIGAS